MVLALPTPPGYTGSRDAGAEAPGRKPARRGSVGVCLSFSYEMILIMILIMDIPVAIESAGQGREPRYRTG